MCLWGNNLIKTPPPKSRKIEEPNLTYKMLDNISKYILIVLSKDRNHMNFNK